MAHGRATGRITVLVLMGGPDAERPVSIASGRAVANALRESGEFEVIDEVIDRPTGEEFDGLAGDVVFPVLHGQWGEGGPLQQILEDLDRPYVGARPQAALLAMDKLRTKALLAREGVATPAAIPLERHDSCHLPPPLVLKPVAEGSSVDIRICRSAREVERARAELHPRRSGLMAECYIAGRELTVGIVSGRILPIIEIRPGVDFYDYDAKYERDDTRYILEPQLPKGAAEDCRKTAEITWRRIGCRDIARVDYRLDQDGRVWFLEVNTMPGFTDHSLVPMAARWAGIPMPELCASLVRAALERASSERGERAKVAL